MKRDKVLSLLGLSMAAGKAAHGAYRAENALQKGKARLLVLAKDAKASTKKKYTRLCRARNIPVMEYATGEALGKALGKEIRVVIAIEDEGLAAALIRAAQEQTGLAGKAVRQEE